MVANGICRDYQITLFGRDVRLGCSSAQTAGDRVLTIRRSASGIVPANAIKKSRTSLIPQQFMLGRSWLRAVLQLSSNSRLFVSGSVMTSQPLRTSTSKTKKCSGAPVSSGIGINNSAHAFGQIDRTTVVLKESQRFSIRHDPQWPPDVAHVFLGVIDTYLVVNRCHEIRHLHRRVKDPLSILI